MHDASEASNDRLRSDTHTMAPLLTRWNKASPKYVPLIRHFTLKLNTFVKMTIIKSVALIFMGFFSVGFFGGQMAHIAYSYIHRMPKINIWLIERHPHGTCTMDSYYNFVLRFTLTMAPISATKKTTTTTMEPECMPTRHTRVMSATIPRRTTNFIRALPLFSRDTWQDVCN